MYEQQLYTRSNYGGVFDNRPGFTTVAATHGLNEKDVEALEHHCEYSISKRILEKCGCRSMPNVRYFMKDANDTYIVGQSCFRKEEGISDREVFLVHNIALKKDCPEYEDFVSNLYHMTGQLPFVTEFCDEVSESVEHRGENDNLFQPLSNDSMKEEREFYCNEEALSAVGISRGMFQMMICAVISAIGTKKKIFINLRCNIEQMTEQAIMVMQHIYAVLPNELRGRVGYQTFYTGENVKNNIMIYFFPSILIDLGRAVNQIGERNLKQDYLFYLSEPIGIQPADVFIEIQNEVGYIDLSSLCQIKQRLDSVQGKLLRELRSFSYKRYCDFEREQQSEKLYGMLFDMRCEEAVNMKDLYSIIHWGLGEGEIILKHTKRISEQCESVFTEMLAFPIKEYSHKCDSTHKEILEQCLLMLLNSISYETDYLYASNELTNIVNARFLNRELRNEIYVLQAVNDALKLVAEKDNCGNDLYDTVDMLPIKVEKRAREVLGKLAHNEGSVGIDEKYIILMSINVRDGQLDFQEMFQSLNMEMLDVSDFIEWYLCSGRNMRRYLDSERGALDYYMMKLCSKRKEPEVIDGVLLAYKRGYKNNKSRRKVSRKVVYAIKAMKRANKRRKVIERFRRHRHEREENSRL